MVELDADGRPNGIFREQASKIYDNLIPDPFLVPATREKCMKKGLALASSLGVTMMPPMPRRYGTMTRTLRTMWPAATAASCRCVCPYVWTICSNRST